MPKLGLTMTEGTIEKWYKKEGEEVKKGDLLLSVVTDKLTNDVEADCSGVLLKIEAEEGSSAPCKGVIAWIGQAGEPVPGAAPAPAAPAPAPAAPKSGAGVVVIGGGPGGYVAAIKAARLGAGVTLIEKDRMGGTCLNRGCIPTKALLHAAEVKEEAETGGEIGIKVGGIDVDWAQVIARKDAVSAQLSNGVSGLMRLHKVKVVRGEACFTGPGTLSVAADGTAETMTPDRIIIATGAVPAIPPIPGVRDNPACIDSTALLSLEKLPASLVIIGGGVIGMEFAAAFARFGTKCTIVEMLPTLLPMMDGELTLLAKKQLEAKGVEFHMETQVVSVDPSPAGGVVNARTRDGGMLHIEAEKILVAVGRRANTASLHLEAAGIDNDRGRILVNDRMETNVQGVYAIGDCVFGRVQLAHTASAMGEVAAVNAMGGNAAYDERTNPSCVYVIPEYASVGYTEEKAKAAGLDYKVGRFPLSANGKSLIMGCTDGVIKVLADRKYNEILGVHIVGPRASDLIAEAALALKLECTTEELVSTIHGHPTISEALREAVLAVDGQAVHSK